MCVKHGAELLTVVRLLNKAAHPSLPAWQVTALSGGGRAASQPLALVRPHLLRRTGPISLPGGGNRGAGKILSLPRSKETKAQGATALGKHPAYSRSPVPGPPNTAEQPLAPGL